MRRAGNGVGASLVTALVLATSGCSASGSVSVGETPSVPGDHLAAVVSEQLTKTVGKKPDTVRCPTMKDAKKGSAVRCTLTDAGRTYGVTVTATEVKGSDVRTDIQVDRTPQG